MNFVLFRSVCGHLGLARFDCWHDQCNPTLWSWVGKPQCPIKITRLDPCKKGCCWNLDPSCRWDLGLGPPQSLDPKDSVSLSPGPGSKKASFEPLCAITNQPLTTTLGSQENRCSCYDLPDSPSPPWVAQTYPPASCLIWIPECFEPTDCCPPWLEQQEMLSDLVQPVQEISGGCVLLARRVGYVHHGRSSCSESISPLDWWSITNYSCWNWWRLIIENHSNNMDLPLA